MNRSLLRVFLPLAFLPLSGVVWAIGLGELRGQPALGERPRLEIDLLGTSKESLDASCFRLVQPVGANELPWLKKAIFSIRKTTPPVLEIRSETPLSEPILQLAVQMTCGIEVVRQYTLLASPAQDRAMPAVALPLVPETQRSPIANAPQAPRARVASPEHLAAEPRRLPTKRADKRPAPSNLSDRLTISGAMDTGEPSLRLATELLSLVGGNTAGKEAQREILRLEYRMLAALHEQVTTQMATAEKLRNLEGTLGELQQHTSDFAQRVEQRNTPVVSPPKNVESPVAQPTPQGSAIPERKPASVAPRVTSAESSDGLSEWSLYGVLIGVVLGLAGWLGWNKFREREQSRAVDEDLIEFSELEVDPERDEEHENSGGIDLRAEPSAMVLPMQVDVELDGGELVHAQGIGHSVNVPAPHDSLMSIGAATLDEHFEANPVMELADIMLSFGRVKGAAQALQEYIDNSPQEALQPWIRLMDVYRMAGMKDEFETVAANLNKNFNVEIQHWDGEQLRSADKAVDLVLDDVGSPPVAPRPESLEDMPRIISMVCELWPTGDVVGYLYQLLRDNRGGKRLGFTLPVVEEILFLVELKETSNRIQ